MSDVSRPASGVCGFCESDRPAYNMARACGLYRGSLAHAIRRFKFNARRSILPALSGFILEADQTWLADVEVDAVIPVPLHPRRLSERGFNQAADLARPVSRRRRAPLLYSALIRQRDTEPQYGLSLNQRRQNVKGAFKVMDPARIRDRKILLVDDIMTTGITVDECVRALNKSGADKVVVLTLARTP